MAPKNIRHAWFTAFIAFIAWAPGFCYAQQLTTFETTNFSGSGVCAFCHSRLSDQAGNDVSNDAQWRSTMMANASKDPLWQAKISAEVDLVPGDLGLEQVIQEKCCRCHMGMARYQQLADGATKTDIYVFDDSESGIIGFLNPTHYLHAAAMDGVSCTLCHQITPENLGTDLSFTGQYVIDTSTVSPDRVIFGPYSNPLINPMRRNSGFRPRFHNPDKQLADSAHCGSCHTLYTPALDEDGGYLKEFPEQTTYLEWEHSGISQTCQDCHLPIAVGSVAISNRPRNLTGRSPFGQHHYVGGNSFMVELLKNYATDLGVTADAAHLDATISRTLTQLQENTATVAATASWSDNELAVTVDVTNLAGHKFPSGLPSRRAWLHVTVADATGAIRFESGAPLEDGKIAGNDAEPAEPNDPLPLDAYEPHYETITSADQVQIYEPVMLNDQGDVTYTLLRAYEYAKDNRLMPAGFEKGSADPDIAVHGNAAEDADFIGGSDRIVYRLDVTGASGELTVTVELLFQTLSYPFVADLYAVRTDPVDRFFTFYNPADNVPVVVDSIQITVN